MQVMFGKYLQEGNLPETAVYELKIEKTNRFSFNKVKEHQIIGLKQAQKGLYHKISDSPIHSGMKTRFTAKKPFDCLYFNNCKGYVVVWFYEPRQPKYCYIIEIDVFLGIEANHKKKSIKKEELDKCIDYYFVRKVKFN